MYRRSARTMRAKRGLLANAGGAATGESSSSWGGGRSSCFFTLATGYRVAVGRLAIGVVRPLTGTSRAMGSARLWCVL